MSLGLVLNDEMSFVISIIIIYIFLHVHDMHGISSPIDIFTQKNWVSSTIGYEMSLLVCVNSFL
jgi:hypothetical protein